MSQVLGGQLDTLKGTFKGVPKSLVTSDNLGQNADFAAIPF